jgi:hypothetical protein
MSITYSTNFMGPITTHWYRDRGLTHMVEKTCESKLIRDILRTSKVLNCPNIEIGDTYEIEEITVHYAGGRIDIYGVPDEHYPLEYGLGVMHGEDWNALGDWLWDFESEELIPYDELIALFEKHYGKKIRWWKDEKFLS